MSRECIRKLAICTTFFRFLDSPSPLALAILLLVCKPPSPEAFLLRLVVGLEGTNVARVKPSSSSRGSEESLLPACALSPDSDLTSFEDPGADRLPSSRIFEMGTLFPEFNFEAEVDSGAASEAGSVALDRAAEMDAAGAGMFSFFVARDFGFFGGALVAEGELRGR